MSFCRDIIPNFGSSANSDSSIVQFQFKTNKIVKILISSYANVFPGQVLGPHENGMKLNGDHFSPFGLKNSGD